MPRRPPKPDPELQAHKEWLGYLQPRGLVVAPAAMWEAGWVLEQGGKELLERQEQFREALQPIGPDEEDNDDDQPRGFRRLETWLVDQLSWDAEALQRDPASLQTWTRELPEQGETLAASAATAPSNSARNSPGATAGPMPSAPTCWPGCWRSTPSASRRSRRWGCTGRGEEVSHRPRRWRQAPRPASKGSGRD